MGVVASQLRLAGEFQGWMRPEEGYPSTPRHAHTRDRNAFERKPAKCQPGLGFPKNQLPATA